MSRTTRLKNLVNLKVVDSYGCLPTNWRHSGGRAARQIAAEEAHDNYRPRPRHSSLCFPHYTSAYEDIFPSVGLWVKYTDIKFKIKPTYTNKKRRVKKK